MGTTGDRARKIGAVAAISLSVLTARGASAAPIQTSRQSCEAALELESTGHPGTSSRGPCHSAFLTDGAPEDMRNEVASLMSPQARPSMDDLVVATLISDAAIRRATDQPWGYLARCDIARRLGGADVLETCLVDLRRVAPDHPATRRAMAFAAEHASPGIWALRLVFWLALLGTLIHALLRRERSTPARIPGAAKPVALLLLTACALLSGFVARVARAEEATDREPLSQPTDKEQLSQFKIDDANPEASIPSPEMQNKRPLEFGYYIQDLAAKAEQATKRGDHATAARFYLALAKAVPTSGVGPRKMCESLEAAGDLQQAVVACRTVLTRSGSMAADYLRFVQLVLAVPGPLVANQRAELDAVLTHLNSEAQLGAVPVVLRCEVALRAEDTHALAACTETLKKTAPNDPKTISFQWALALEKHDRSTALQLLDRARAMGVSADGVAKMERATRQMTLRLVRRFVLLALGAAVIAALLALGFRHLSQRRRLAV
jgi:hypothetical protein